MSWSKKYKKSIDCSNPKGFSQKAHCAGRKARKRGETTKSKSVNEMKIRDLKEEIRQVIRERGVKAIQKDYSNVVADMEKHLELYKKSKGTPQEKKHIEHLKALTAKKKKLQSELDTAVTNLYKNAELKVEESINEASNTGEKIQNLNNRIKVLRAKITAQKDAVKRADLQRILKNALQRLSDIKKDYGIKPPHKEGVMNECWDGYKQVGMKMKGGKSVPNCVPESVEVNEAFKHLISVETPTQVVSKPIAAQIEKLAKKGVKSSEIGLKMGFVGNQKLATDAFQKVKNKIYFALDKRNESVNEVNINETKFIAFFNNKKIDIDAKDLWDAKQKAIIQLKVPKAKIGYLAVVSAESQKNQNFRFENANELNISEIEYKDAVEKFNADLMKNSQVQRISKFHKRSIKDVVKALQPYLKVLRYSDKSIKVISIDFRDTNSDVKVHVSQTYKQNESVNENVSFRDGKYHFYSKDGVGYLAYGGKVLSSGDFDWEDGSNSYWMSHSSWGGQKAFDTGKDVIAYFKKNKIVK